MDNKNNLTSSKLFAKLSPTLQREMEIFVVNSVKVKMIKKMDTLLETEGKVNVRKLFLVPIFDIPQMTKRVDEQAPELKTFFYKELVMAINEAEKRLV